MFTKPTSKAENLCFPFRTPRARDLKSPLMTLLIESRELKEKQYFEEKDAAILNLIYNSTQRMNSLVVNVLQYSEVQEGEKNENCRIDTIFKEICSDLAQMIVEAEATFSLQKLPALEGGQTQLRRLFQKLIINSMKYCKKVEVPKLKIWSEVDPEYIHIIVEDKGIGLDSKHKDAIFEPFYRVSTDKANFTTELGLPNLHCIMQNYNGSIKAEGALGEGFTFKLSFLK